MYGFQNGKINVQTKSACRSDFPNVNCMFIIEQPSVYSWYNHKKDEVQDWDLWKIDRAFVGGASTIQRLAVRVQRPYPAEAYMEKNSYWNELQECHMSVHLLTTCVWLPWKFRLQITESRVRIQLETRTVPNLNSASLHRAFYVHPSINPIRLKYCWNGRKTPNHPLSLALTLLVMEKNSVFWLGLGWGRSIHMVPFSEPFWCLCLWHIWHCLDRM